MASIINDKCTNCTVCATVCPTGSIFVGAKHYVIDSDTCEDCHFCVQVCPVNAIKAVKKAPPPEAQAETAKQEKGKVKPKTW